MSVTLRPYDAPNDAPRLAELLTQHGPEPITAAQLLEWERMRSQGSVYLSLAAVGPDGTAVGFAEVSRAPWTAAGHFGLEGIVDPADRNRGIGTLLLRELTAFAQARGATLLKTSVRDHHADALRFVQNRGFEMDRHIFESTLDLQSFDETPFADAITRAELSGFVFRSLADHG